jgi:Na+/glutamate symporter
MYRDDFRSDDVVLDSRIEGSFLKRRLCLLLSTFLNRFLVLETSEIPPFHVSMSVGVVVIQVLLE